MNENDRLSQTVNVRRPLVVGFVEPRLTRRARTPDVHGFPDRAPVLRPIIGLLIIAGVLLLRHSPAQSANSIVIESKNVSPGATGVVVGIYFANDIPVSDIEFPVEVRQQTPGSYIANVFEEQVYPIGRLNNSPLGQAGANWPAASVYTGVFDETILPPCSGPLSET